MTTQEILQLASVLHSNIAAAIALLSKLKEAAQAQGATKEQLTALAMRYDDAIARREAELGDTSTASSQAPNTRTR